MMCSLQQQHCSNHHLNLDRRTKFRHFILFKFLYKYMCIHKLSYRYNENMNMNMK